MIIIQGNCVLETEVYVFALRRITLFVLASHLHRHIDGVQAREKAPLKTLCFDQLQIISENERVWEA